MRKLLSCLLAGWVSLSPFLNGALSYVLAAPSVGAPAISPATVPAKVPAEVTVTSRIVSGPGDPAVLATGVNLLRIDAQNRVIKTIGVMRDDGTQGDAVVGDGVFTLRFTTTEPAAGELRLRVSAAFRGLAQRILSPVSGVPIQVAQNQPPTFTSTPVAVAVEGTPYSYQASAQDPEGGQLTFQLVSGPSGMIVNQTTGAVQWTPTKAQVGDQNIQLKVSDPQGASATQSYTIRVSAANIPPSITSAPNTSATEGTLYSYQVTAQDPEGSQLTFQLLAAPSGMSLGANNGLLQWTPTKAQIGDQNVQLRVLDPQGASATQTFTIRVVALNQPPVITSIPNTTATESILYLYQVVAQDPENGQISYQLVSGPAGMTLGQTSGLLLWTPTKAQVGDQNVQVRVSDTQGLTATQTFTARVKELNLAPIITSVPVTSAETGKDYNYAVIAYDPEKQPLSFSFASAQPAGMTIDSATGLVRWLPTTSQTGSVQIAVRATDPKGAFDTQTYNLKVSDASKDLEILSPTAAQTIRIGQTLTLPLQANYTGATFSAIPLPKNAAIKGSNFEFTPTADQEGVQTVTFQARYGGLVKSNVITITVTRDNSAPVFTPVGQQTVQENSTLSFTISATDAENDPLTYSAPGLNLANAFFNAFTRQLTFNPVVGQAGKYEVAFSVSDSRATSQIMVPIEVTKSTGQQQVLDLVVDPVNNPTLLGSTTISGNITGEIAKPPPKQVPPLLTGLVPSVAKQGQTVTVQITGLNTNFGQTTSRADFGEGITVNSLTVTSATSAQASLTVDKAARLGTRTVRILGAGTEAPSVVTFNIEKGVASITGLIVDPFTNQPLAGARIAINGTSLSVLTDSEGRFTLIDVPTGSVPLLVTLPNYEVQQLTIGVGAGDVVLLPSVIKMNALARPPRLAGTLPRAATVASVLDRGIASTDRNMTLEDAKAAISDTMLTVGGSDAGVLDAEGRQLNPKVQGSGQFSLNQQGIENHARMLRLGQTYRIRDILFQLRGTYSFALRFGSDTEILVEFQRLVNEAWANPDDPGSAMPLIVFSSGTTRSALPPILSLDTRINSFQAFLIHASFLAHFATDIDHAIIELARKNGVPPPQISAISPGTGRGITLASRATSALDWLLTTASRLVRPANAFAADVSVAERRLAEKLTFTKLFAFSRVVAAVPDLLIGGATAMALAYAVGSTVNMLMAAAGGQAGTSAALTRQVLLAGAIGAAFAVFQKILTVYALENVIQFLHPDPPIGESTVLLKNDKGEVVGAELVFSVSAAETQTTTTLPDGTVIHRLPNVTDFQSALVRASDAINGLDTSKISFQYKLFKMRDKDDENIVQHWPLPISPVPVKDSQNRIVPNKLKFIIPKQFIQDEVNYFRMATYQLYNENPDTVAETNQAGVQPFHYQDLGVEIPSQLPDWAGTLLSFLFGFNTPGVSLNIIPEAILKRLPLLRLVNDRNIIGGPDYLDPIFRQANEAAAAKLVASEAAAYENALSEYIQIHGLKDDDPLLLRGKIAETEKAVKDSLDRQKGQLQQKVATTAKLQKVADITEAITNNLGTSFQDTVNDVTRVVAEKLGSENGQIPFEAAPVLDEYRIQAAVTKQARDTLGVQGEYLKQLAAFESEFRTFRAQPPPIIGGDSAFTFTLKGRPQIDIDAENFKFNGEPTVTTEDLVIRVNDRFSPIDQVQISVETPAGQQLQLTTVGALRESETAKKTQLETLVQENERALHGTHEQMRRLLVSDAEVQGLTADFEAERAKTKGFIRELNKLRARLNQITNPFKARAQKFVGSLPLPEITPARVLAFQSAVTKFTNFLSAAGFVYWIYDTRKSIQLAASIMPSILSEVQIVSKPRNVGTGTARIAADPLVANGILTVEHLSEAEARQDPNNANRRFPIVDGKVGLLVFTDQGASPIEYVVPSAGFPSDYFAVDGKGRIYANNRNSNENFGGRIFRFTRPADNPILNNGAGVVREFAGSINYYSMDAFLPPQPAEPIAMGIGDYCCFNGVVETPFIADVDLSANPPEGRIRRIPVEQMTIPGARLLGQTWVSSPELKLETPSTLVPGQLIHNTNPQNLARPIFISDGPRIWISEQVALGGPGQLTKVVETPGREWGGLLVNPNGDLIALDRSNAESGGKVWLLPLSVVKAAIASSPLTNERFEEAAFVVATGHKGGLDMVQTADHLGFFVADPGGEIALENAAIVGVLPNDVVIKSLELFLPRLGTKTPVLVYTSGGKKRFLAQVPVTERKFNGAVLIASVGTNGHEREYDLTIVPPLFGTYIVPEDDLARRLRGQQ